MSFDTDHALKQTILEKSLESIRATISQTYPHGSRILGSKLGFLITPLISPLNLKDYGGLKLFAREYLGSLVQRIDRINSKEGDDVYLVRTSPGPEPILDGWQEVTSATAMPLWPAFSNPSIAAYFAVPPSKDTLLCSQTQQPLPEDWLDLKKVSEQDYKRLAHEFIASKVPLTQYQQANTVISTPPFAKALATFLREQCSTDTFTRWETKRVAWVIDSFATRLEKAGVSDHARTRLIELLKQSRDHIRSRRTSPIGRSISPTEKAFTKPPAFSRFRQGTITNDKGTTDINRVRETLHRAIDQMSLEELRALRLPLGVLIDDLMR